MEFIGLKSLSKSVLDYLIVFAFPSLPFKRKYKFIDQLNDKYREFFDNFEKFGKHWYVEDCVRFSYAIIIFVFSSPALTFLKRDNLMLDHLNDDDLLPDNRFQVFSEWFKPEHAKEMREFSKEKSKHHHRQNPEMISEEGDMAMMMFDNLEYLNKSNYRGALLTRFAMDWLVENCPMDTIYKSETNWGDIANDYAKDGMLSGAMKPLQSSAKKDEVAHDYDDPVYLQSLLSSEIYASAPNLSNELIVVPYDELNTAHEITRQNGSNFYFLASHQKPKNSVYVVQHVQGSNKVGLSDKKHYQRLLRFDISGGLTLIDQLCFNLGVGRLRKTSVELQRMPQPSAMVFRFKNVKIFHAHPFVKSHLYDPLTEVYLCPYSMPSRFELKANGINQIHHVPQFPILWYLDTEIEVMLFDLKERRRCWGIYKIDKNLSVVAVWIEGLSGVVIKILPNVTMKSLVRVLRGGKCDKNLFPIWKHPRRKMIKRDVLGAVENIKHLWEDF